MTVLIFACRLPLERILNIIALVFVGAEEVLSLTTAISLSRVNYKHI